MINVKLNVRISNDVTNSVVMKCNDVTNSNDVDLHIIYF